MQKTSLPENINFDILAPRGFLILLLPAEDSFSGTSRPGTLNWKRWARYCEESVEGKAVLLQEMGVFGYSAVTFGRSWM